jgi:hypothetical protein
MNAVLSAPAAPDARQNWNKETIAGGGLDNKQFNNYVPPGDPLAQFFAAPSTTWTPRVLKDGSDSVGALGALNRVYLNIGLFSEEWLLHFRPIIGGQAISPIPIADGREELRVLARHGDADARHGALLSTPARTALLKDLGPQASAI